MVHLSGFLVDSGDFSIRRLSKISPERLDTGVGNFSRENVSKMKRLFMYEKLIRDGEVENHNLNISSLM